MASRSRFAEEAEGCMICKTMTNHDSSKNFILLKLFLLVVDQNELHAGKLFIHIGPTFLWQNYSAIIYLIHFKFRTVKGIFIINASMVLDFLLFVFLAGK